MEAWRIVRTIASGVLHRRMVLLVVTFVLAAVLFSVAAYSLSEEPPRFQSQATILVESRPERVPIFQDFLPFRPLPVQLALLNSRNMAEGVLENLPKNSIQDLVDTSYHVDYQRQVSNWYRRLRGLEPEVESPQRRALRELQGARVAFDTRMGHGIVTISAAASKPQVASDIVATYIEVLLARTRTFNIDDARVSREFLESQATDVKRSLQASEEALRAFTAGHGGVKVPEQAQATVVRLNQADSALAEVVANRKMVETRLQALKEKVESQKGSAPAPAAPARPMSPSVQRVRDQLTRLESALIELRTKYTEEHPRVMLVRDQIAELQRELGGVVRETTPSTPAPGAVPAGERINFSEQVVLLETSLHSLSAQEAALGKQVDVLRQSLSGLSRSESDYTRLTRDVDSNRSLYAMLSDKLTAARIREQGEMKVVKVIDSPSPAVLVGNTKRMRFMGIGLLAAVALGVGVPALIEWIKRPVETEEDVESSTGLPVLAVIPLVRGRRPIFLTARERRELEQEGLKLGEVFLFHEAFRTLRVALQLAGRAGQLRSLMVTSANPGEGKSTTLVNLGLELGETGRRVIMADTDFARPTLHKTLNLPQNGGLVEVLHSGRQVEEALVPVRGNVRVATRGAVVRQDTPGMLATTRLGDVLAEMSNQADYVLCDSGPILVVPENLMLAGAVDGVVLVVKAGTTPCADLARAKTTLEGVGARVIGVVINQVPSYQLKHYYKRSDRGHYARSEAS
jgi:polysaccharide biosynthesis transport protein